MTSQIRVAISGGGVAGASLLHAVLPYPHIDAHIFESAPKFREAGVAFGVSNNARVAMDLVGPSARACLDRAGGVQMNASHAFIAQGEDTGETVNSFPAQSTTIVQRANLLHEFLEGIPPERMHASKKLTSVDRRDDASLLLHFADGSTHECDILIGADGVHSTVRKIVLGEDDPAAHAQNTGGWALMTLNPYEQALGVLGKSLVNIENPIEQAGVGRGSFILTTLLSNNETVQFSIFSMAELPLADPAEADNRWSRTVTADWLKQQYIGHGWEPRYENGVREILCSEPTRQVIFLWEHPHARTYVSGPICVFGDAAHATTPYMGSGGGMCIEDTMILSTLLGRVSTPAEAITALKVYDQIRRPRTQAVVEASKRTGELLTGSDAEIGIQGKRLKKALDNRWDFIVVDHDNKKHQANAIELLQRELQESRQTSSANGTG